MDNVSFDILINFLKLCFKLRKKAILAVLNDFDEEKTSVLSAPQFVNMMKNLNGIDKRVAKKCRKVFHKYDYNEDGYIDNYDLQGLFFANNLYVTIQYAGKIVNNYDKNEDMKLNFIDFAHFFKHQNFLMNTN